jgi:hypothetical protein
MNKSIKVNVQDIDRSAQSRLAEVQRKSMFDQAGNNLKIFNEKSHSPDSSRESQQSGHWGGGDHHFDPDKFSSLSHMMYATEYDMKFRQTLHDNK